MKRVIIIAATIAISILFSLNNLAFADDSNDLPRYIVQSGDSLGVIALQFGVSVDDLIKANSLADANAIKAGDELIIPGLEGISGILIEKVAGVGQNLRNLVIQNNLSAQNLIKLNHLSSPSGFYVGAAVIVPQSEENCFIPIGRLKQNQTLLSIAIRNNQNPYLLKLTNESVDDWGIIPGDELFIRSGPNHEENSDEATQQENSISISPLPLVQGQTGVIKITASDASKISGNIAGNELIFMQTDEHTASAIFGISAMQDPGLVEFSLDVDETTGNPLHLSQMLIVSSGNYGKDAPFVVDPLKIDPEIIGPEEEKLKEITSVITPTRYWSEKFKYPIDEPCINSLFGNRRSYNGSAYTYFHTGVDFGVCANNLNIYADAPGVVVLTEYQEVCGNTLVIDHGWGIFTRFCHLESYAVAQGDNVQTGQMIGQIGNTGRSTGPHLHWEILVHSIQVNPFTWIENDYLQ
jgi:murein DD-endopeptidase MepM/ murein hydrolase activator NlpD